MNLSIIRKKLLSIIPYIKEAYINEFGEVHRKEIEEKLNSTLINLENSYQLEYNYLEKNPDSYSEEELKLIKFKAHKESYKINGFKHLANKKAKKIIKNILNIDITDEAFPHFFDNNYHLEGGLIDYFSNIANKILNDPHTNNYVKKDILKHQKEFIKLYGIIPDENTIELLTKEFSKIRKEYYLNITTSTDFGNNFIKLFEENFGYICSQENIHKFLSPLITSGYNSTMGSFVIINNMETFTFNKDKLHSIINIPVAKVLKTYNCIDLINILIHEIGHNLCFNYDINLRKYYEENKYGYPLKNEFNLFRELLNEYRSKKILSKLLSLDNLNIKNSSYDLAISLIKNFFDIYYPLLKEMDFNSSNLEEYINTFGPSFKSLIAYVYYEYQKIDFYSYKKSNIKEKPITYNEESFRKINQIIQDINEYCLSSKRNKH